MWSGFIVASFVFIAVLYVPGFLVFKAIGMRNDWSLCCSPLPGISLLAIAGQLLSLLRISSSPLIIFILLILVPAVILLVMNRGARIRVISLPQIPALAIVLSLALGVALGYNLFVSRLDAPHAIFQAYDVTQHLNLIRSMADSGNFTSLGVSPYLAHADQAINPFYVPGFYPAAWHVLCALVVQITGVSVPVAINASMFVFSCIIYPLALLPLLSNLFDGNKTHLVCGAIVALSFVSFPWALMTFGPVYPNLAGLAVAPIAAALFMVITSSKAAGVSTRVKAGAALLVCIAGLALLHPNTIFTCAVLLVPYCAARIWEACRVRSVPIPRTACACLGFIAFCLLAWYACYKLPFMQGTVTHVWPPYLRLWQALVNIATQIYTMGFYTEMAAQLLVATLVVIGIIKALHTKHLRWLPVSYALACFIFIAAATRQDEFKQLVAGFWYTDTMRIAAMATIIATPLAALGLAWVFHALLNVVRSYNRKLDRETHAAKIAVLGTSVFLLVNFMPEFNLPGMHTTYSDEVKREYQNVELRDWPKNVHTTFGDYRALASDTYSYDMPLSGVEETFIDKVKEIVPVGDLVINDPMDGSFLTYGTDGIRVYYRDFVGYGLENETAASRIIRTKLCDYASDPEVQQAVQEIDAKYVLVLSQSKSDISFINLREDYKPGEFAGISSITRDTPGFTCVLQAGSMMLYRIDR